MNIRAHLDTPHEPRLWQKPDANKARVATMGSIEMGSRGFTLLEMLVALVIFAMISVGAFRLLGSTGALQERADERISALTALQRTMRDLERDISQLASFGEEDPSDELGLPDGDTVWMTSYGWRNPQQRPRSNLQTVAWVLDADGILWRCRWPQDASDPDDVRHRPMMADVEAIEWRYLDREGKWLNQWKPEREEPKQGEEKQLASILPAAVQIQLQTKVFGEVRRYVSLR